jgi:hypothetical protein
MSGAIFSFAAIFIMESTAAHTLSSLMTTFVAVVSFGCGAGMALLFARFCLPLSARGVYVAEMLVLLAWLCGIVQLYVFMIYFDDKSIIGWQTFPEVVKNSTLLAFFALGPLPFVALCWGRFNWDVMRVLMSQTQFRLVCVLVLWCITTFAWGLCASAPGLALYGSAMSCLIFSPLIMALFLDGLEQQSHMFRLGLPALYVVYVASESFYHSILRRPRQLIFIGNNSWVAEQPLFLEDSFQIASALWSILLLMCQFLYRTRRDLDGSTICWPLVATVGVLKKEAGDLRFTGLGFLRALPNTGLLSRQVSTVQPEHEVYLQEQISALEEQLSVLRGILRANHQPTQQHEPAQH